MNKQIHNQSIKKKIKKLIDLINYHDDLYYNKNYQEISDEEYDKIRNELLNIEKIYPNLSKKNSPTKRVGSFKSTKFSTIEHVRPMLSLNNAYEVKEVKDFFDRSSRLIKKKIEIMAETKVDGLSASLRYENRNLKIALTRGDGVKGEDITRNIMSISGVKKELPPNFPSKLEIRGEIFMPKNIFVKLNQERKDKGLDLFSTPRNAAAGSVRQIDPNITKKRKLSFFGYTILCENLSLGNTLTAIRDRLKEEGFSLNEPSKLCNSVEDMLKFHKFIHENREQLNYDIDGIVYKINSLKDQNYLGSTNRYPRWALAHKFPSEVNYTKIKDVVFQVGRTGSITPVAILQPVIIGGVKISRATLHNEDEIKRLDVMIGDTVSIQRAGDVIPKITSVLKEKRVIGNKKIEIPNYCPSCGSKLYKVKGEAIIRCINIYSCEEQLLNRLCHFVSRGAFNIDGLGEKVIKSFWEKGYIKNYLDIFDMDKRIKDNLIDIYSLHGWGKKSINNLLISISKAKDITFDRFIFSLGIRHVGQGISVILSNKFNSINELINYFTTKNKKNFLDVEGVGDIILNSIKDFFSLKRNQIEILGLLKHVNIKYKKQIENNFYSGKTFVITGSFEGQSRTKIQEKLRLLGSKITTAISNNTDFLLAGNAPGSKLKKATELKIKILYQEDLKKIMDC